MSATDAFENEIIDLIFTNITFAGIGDGGGLLKSVADGVFHVSLHTTTLSDTSADQSVGETTYTSYARESVARTTGGWSVTATTNVDNVAAITFTTGTGGSGTVTDFGIGDAVSGATALHFFGALDSSLVVGNGVQPEFAIGALNITCD